VNLLAGAKTQSNPESCVGVLSLAGKVPKMLVTPTPDLGKVLNSMHDLQMAGHVNFATGVQARRAAARRAAPGASTDAGKPWLSPGCRVAADARCRAAQVAMLALKHRQNKSQRQRVVIFSGSPVADDEASLVKLGKKLKKNNVACDVVAFANVEENEAKLQARGSAHARACTQLRTRLRVQG
jgi:26S proteasome regulatory subunit N10